MRTEFHGTCSRSSRRLRRMLGTGLALLMLTGAGSAIAVTTADCVPVVTPNPGSGAPGAPTAATSFTVSLVEGTAGGDTCSGTGSVSLSINGSSTVSGSPALSTPSGAAPLNFDTDLSLVTSSGTLLVDVLCTAGCEGSAPVSPNTQLTVNVADSYSISATTPTGGMGAAVSGQSIPLEVQVLKNGLGSGLTVSEGEVCFEFASAPANGSSLSGGTGACGSGGRTAQADANGFASVQLDVGTTTAVSGESLSLQATAVNIAGLSPAAFTINVNDFYDIAIEQGDGQATGLSSAFAQPLQVRTQRNFVNFGTPITWTITGDATFQVNGSTTYTESTGPDGLSSLLTVNAGSVGGAISVQATIDGTGGDANIVFSLNATNSPAIAITSAPVPTYFVGSAYNLTVRALNNSLPVADGTAILFESDPNPSCINSNLTLSATSVPVAGGNGEASITLTPNTVDLHCVRARWDAGMIGDPGDDPTVSLQFFSDSFNEISIVTPVGGTATVLPGTPIDLTVLVNVDGGFPTDPFTRVTFSYTRPDSSSFSQMLTPSASDGLATISFNETQIGNYVVTAVYDYTAARKSASGLLPIEQIFNISVRNTVVATGDDFSATPILGVDGGTTASVFANDTFNGGLVTAGQVNASIANNDGLTGVGINTDGTLSIPANSAIGVYAVVYEICDALDATTCSQATANLRVVRQELRNVSNSAPNYPGGAGTVTVRSVLFDGSTDTPDAGVAITFDIQSPASASFDSGNPASDTSLPTPTDTNGFATSQAVFIGPEVTDVVVSAGAVPRTPVSFTLPVSAPTYSLSAPNTPPPLFAIPGQSVNLEVLLEKTVPALGPIDNEDISWSVSPAATPGLGSVTSTTGIPAPGGVARNTFSANTAGIYTVTASYDPGIAGVSPISFDFQVFVDTVAIAPVLPAGGTATIITSQPINLTARLSVNGSAVPSQPVDWSLVSGSGTISPASQNTNASGDSTTSFTPTADGVSVIRASHLYTPTGTTYSTDFTITSVAAAPALTVTKSATLSTDGGTPGVADAGDVVTYQVRVDNTGNVDVNSISVSDVLESNPASILTGCPSALVAGGFGVCSNYTYTVTSADVDAGGTLDNSATASGIAAVGGAVSSAPGSAAITLAASAPGLSVTKTATLTTDSGGNGLADVGDVISYQVRVTNTGNVDVNSITVSDVFEGGPSTLLAGCPTTLAAGSFGLCGSYTYTVTAGDVATGGSLDNSASASGLSPLGATIASPPSTASIAIASALSVRTLRKPATGSGDGQSAPAGTTLPTALNVIAETDGLADAGVQILWQATGGAVLASGSSTTDSLGRSSMSVTLPAVAGTATITASRADEPTATTSFVVTATANAVSLTAVSGDNQTGGAGSTGQPLVVELRQNGAPVASQTVTWSVLSGGASVAQASSATDPTGRASVGLNFGNTIGTSVIRASALGATTQFTVVTSNGAVLRVVSGSGQRGLIQTRADQLLTVAFEAADGTPRSNEPISWQVLSGDAALDATSTLTDGNGRSALGLTFGDAAGLIQVAASSPGAAMPAVFTLTAVNPNASTTGGNGQTGQPGQTLAEPLQVQVGLDARKSLQGVQVQWQVLTGGGSLAQASSTTNSNGIASNSWTLGDLIGQQLVAATLPDGQQLVFEATAQQPVGSVRIVSGDNQTLPTNTDSAPLVVEVKDASGNALANRVIQWTGSNASTADESSTTDAQGRAQTIARVLTPGAASVRALLDGPEGSSVQFALNGGVAEIPTLTPDQEEVGDAIDSTCPALAALSNRTPEQEDLFQRCSELVDNAGDNPDEVQGALDELPTDIGTTLTNSGLDSIGTQTNNIDLRLHQVRGQQSTGRQNQFNLALWTPDGSLPLSFLPSAIAAGATEEEAAAEAGAEFSRWGFFATGQIGRGEYEGGRRSPKFDFDIAGLTAGVDYRFNDRWIGGVALGYTNNDAELPSGAGTLDTTGWSLAGYATWYNERSWYVDGSLLYGSNSYDMTRRVAYSIRALDGGRTVIDQRANSSTDGSNLGATLSVGRDWQKGAWSLSSYVRGAYERVETDAYAERMIANLPGQGLALAVDERSTKSITSVIGSRATYVMSRDWGILMPTASVEWEHEFQDDPNRITARFLHDPSGALIVQEGDEIDANYFNVGFGVSALFPGGRSAFLQYEQLVGASRLKQGVLSLGMRFEF